MNRGVTQGLRIAMVGCHFLNTKLKKMKKTFMAGEEIGFRWSLPPTAGHSANEDSRQTAFSMYVS